MANRSHVCVRVFVLALLLDISLVPICHAKVVNDIRRTKRELSVHATPQPRENSNYDARKLEEVNLKHEKHDDNLEENDTHVRRKREDAKSPSNLVNNDVQRPNVEKWANDNAAIHLNLRSSNEKSDHAEETDDEDEEEEEEEAAASNLVRLPRNANADLKYTDQDERSSLYDDYEIKDVAKRGAEDYEEIEEDSPDVLEDLAAVREEDSPAYEAEERKARSDVRTKRDQAIPEALNDNAKSRASDPLESEGTKSDGTVSKFQLDSGSPGESKIAADELRSREVSSIESSNGIDEPSVANNDDKLAGSALIEAVPNSSDASSAKDSNTEYEKRAEELIQRKIDSIKDEIRRDIEAQRRTRDIQQNNARFDELHDESDDDEGVSIEKLQTKKRSTRDVDVVASSKSGEKKRSPKGQRERPQRRSSEIGKSDNNSKKRSSREKPKRRSAGDRDESSGQKGFFEKKRDRVRETILVKNDRHRAKNRRARSHEPGQRNGKLGNELSAGQDLTCCRRASDGMTPLQLTNEDEDNEEGQSPEAGRADPLVSFTGSSQELSPRLAKEYKEAFGGLQSESGNALARFKRIKRVLGPDVKI